MDFTKLHSLGNDFILIEGDLDNSEWPETAVWACDRHFGIGGDGLLVLMPSQKADYRMRIFNNDGSEAEACGNGLRCLVKYILEFKEQDKQELTIETAAGVRKATISGNTSDPDIKTGMGEPILETIRIPVEIEDGKGHELCGMTSGYPLSVNGQEHTLAFVSMGNPHAIEFIESDLEAFPLGDVGPSIEKHSMFPSHTNYEIARVIDNSHIEMRVWERGVGETLACGSGACAVVVASWIMGLTEGQVDIKLPGGELKAEWAETGEVYLTGRAQVVFSGNTQGNNNSRRTER
ncbi:diaminopimelate epimerase [Dehalogenimonas lykanthroporepellens BL-DC-9]|jgi:diaminopimelate epimerase|nr:diaminopimelate epimerase [Dehalogenimonas lykanthroporepellens BL-DC-9]